MESRDDPAVADQSGEIVRAVADAGLEAARRSSARTRTKN